MKTFPTVLIGHPVCRACFVVAVLSATLAVIQAAAPVVSNIRASQRPQTQLVDIFYDVTDADSSVVSVAVSMSSDAGASYSVPIHTLSGAQGASVPVGLNRQITWNAGVDWPGRFSSQCKVRIVADDGTAPPTPQGMVYIPAGAFQMGDSFHEGSAAELPPHNVFISAFFMDKYEVYKEQWQDVYAWALGHNYDFNHAGAFSGAGFPVTSISWFDAAKWCNARSEKEGYTPVYYNDVAQTSVYRAGQFFNMPNSVVKWNANGYRLPTEAEWEKAARGGLNGMRFPWGDNINGGNANYASSGDPYDDGTTPVGYYNGGQSPGGTNMVNGFGLYDVAGNVSEWCWDSFSTTFYGQAAALIDDPVGPSIGGVRVLRGGDWSYGSSFLFRCADRSIYVDPGTAVATFGFRSVKRP
jgi:formylglycine-generating enzyme required for sulfatase activity